MNINFAMWRTAFWTLVKIDKKEEWDRLDVVSKWLISPPLGGHGRDPVLVRHRRIVGLA
ncbi:MAG: hypothetical protein NTY23_07660 [Chloroflexi bacterium]|nr:hypothetical protein [Chloroflexota bacterium]